MIKIITIIIFIISDCPFAYFNMTILREDSISQEGFIKFNGTIQVNGLFSSFLYISKYFFKVVYFNHKSRYENNI